MELELSVFRSRLLQGCWSASVSVDDRELAAKSDSFTEVCWHNDENCDYLELEKPLAEGWTLQRQILLARDERFLFLADALICDEPRRGRLTYEASLPLGADAPVWKPAAQTREGELETANGRVLVLPLFQPEWRSERLDGGLTVSDGRLLWSLETHGEALYAPLWINLDRRRVGLEHTWRRLTVAHQLQICRPDEAAGYRVQQGNKQWLIYRSLGKKAVRTLLGQNLLSDFTAARFHRDGHIDEIVEIEAQ